MISFAIRVRLSTVSAWLRNPACAMTSRLPSPPVILDEIRDLPVALVGRGANHQHGIDAHVDDAAVLGEAALRHEALHQAGGVFDREIAGFELPGVPVSDLCLASGFQASGKSANIHGSSGAIGGNPGFNP